MRVVITGGSGLIGKALAYELVESGYEVVILSRKKTKPTELGPKITQVGWDGYSAEGWGEYVNGAEAVVNLAGENLSNKRWTKQQKEKILSSRINAGKAVVEAIQKAEIKPKVLIQISGVGAYGTDPEKIFTEENAYGSDFLASVSRKWEDSTNTVENMGVRRVVVRNAVVLDTTKGALPRMLLPFKFFIGGRLGSGSQWMPWIHIKDEVKAIKFLIENHEINGVINLSAGCVSNKEFTQQVSKVIKRPGVFLVPGFLLRIIFGEMSALLLEGQRVSNARLINFGYRFVYDDFYSAVSNLLEKKVKRKDKK